MALDSPIDRKRHADDAKLALRCFYSKVSFCCSMVLVLAVGAVCLEFAHETLAQAHGRFVGWGR